MLQAFEDEVYIRHAKAKEMWHISDFIQLKKPVQPYTHDQVIR